jgi:hypothetical protein
MHKILVIEDETEVRENIVRIQVSLDKGSKSGNVTE